MTNQELKYWLAFSEINKIGAKRFGLLRQHFGSAEIAYDANYTEYREAGLDEKTSEEIVMRRREIDPDELLAGLAKENVSVITIDEPLYPRLLKEIYNPPFILYYKGNLEIASEQPIAVVGTRKISNYGKVVTPAIVEQLVEQGFTIVSGLALGVDALAHHAALKRKKNTIAVLASGLDAQNIYPSINRSLYQEIIAQNGLIISEYPIGRAPLKQNFPARNRIISGLSLGTLIIEAGESSGALITAAFALEQNREVFAIPGPIGSETSIGTNNLIKKGAKLVTCVEDILDELNLQKIKQFATNRETIPDSPEEATILRYLEEEPRHINELANLSNLTITEVNATLMLLEMKGRVRNLGNMTYCKCN